MKRAYFMKLKACLLICAVIFSPLVLAESDVAHDDDDLMRLIVDVPFVEMHSGPNLAYPVVHVVEQGEEVTIILKRTAWLKVKDKRGNQGWLHELQLNKMSKDEQRLLFAQHNQSDFENRQWETGVSYGVLEEADYFNLSFTYAFDETISSELSFAKALGRISDSSLYQIKVLNHPFPTLMVSPYIGISAGMISTQSHSVLAKTKDSDDITMGAFLGLKTHLARNFFLRAEYNFALVLTERDINEEIESWTIGFSVFF